MKIKPRGNYVLVEKLPETSENLVIVESTKARTFKAKVVAFGCDTQEVYAGAIVLIPRALEHQHANQYLIPETDILGIEESDTPTV